MYLRNGLLLLKHKEQEQEKRSRNYVQNQKIQ